MWNTNPSLGNLYGDMPHAAGRYYDSRISAATGTVSLSANTLYAVPFYVPSPLTYTSIAIEVTTLAAASNARLGIYRDTSGAPNALVLDAGTVSVATTGAKTISISQVLTAGWYWLAIVSNGAPATRSNNNATQCMGTLGFTSGTDTTFHAGWSVAFTYASLPNPFTGGGALMTGSTPRLLLGV